MKKMFFVCAALFVAQPSFGSPKKTIQKVALPVANIGGAFVGAADGAAGKDAVSQGLEEIAAWAEGRPSQTKGERARKAREKDLRLLKDLLGEDGLTEYLLGPEVSYVVPYGYDSAYEPMFYPSYSNNYYYPPYPIYQYQPYAPAPVYYPQSYVQYYQPVVWL